MWVVLFDDIDMRKGDPAQQHITSCARVQLYPLHIILVLESDSILCAHLLQVWGGLSLRMPLLASPTCWAELTHLELRTCDRLSNSDFVVSRHRCREELKFKFKYFIS